MKLTSILLILLVAGILASSFTGHTAAAGQYSDSQSTLGKNTPAPTRTPRPTPTPLTIPPPSDPNVSNMLVGFGVLIVTVIILGIWINRRRIF